MRILKLKEIEGITALSRTTMWRLERAGNFPARIHLSDNSVGWDEAEVLAWVASRPRGLSATTRQFSRASATADGRGLVS